MAAARHSVKSTVLVRRPPLTVVLVWLINDWCLVVPVWLCLCVLAWVNVIGCDYETIILSVSVCMDYIWLQL